MQRRRFIVKSGGALVAHDAADGSIIGSSRYHGYDSDRSEIEIGWSFLARRRTRPDEPRTRRQSRPDGHAGSQSRYLLEHLRYLKRVCLLAVSPC